MLRVLTYHRIAEPSQRSDLDPGLVSATPGVFRKQMAHLRRRYRPMSLAEIMDAFEAGVPIPPRSVHVTVDDAYRDFREVAWPILREMEIPVTVFVPTAYPDQAERAFWWDRLHRAVGASSTARDWGDAVRAAATAQRVRLPAGGGDADVRKLLRLLPHDAAESLVDQACVEVGAVGGGVPATGGSSVLGWDELRELQDEGVTFGAHTRHHVALTRVGLDRARHEIRRSLDDLIRELGEGRRAIAYPYGMCSPAVARIAQEEGCLLGFTGEDGLNTPGRTDPLGLRRTNITLRTSPTLFALRMVPLFARIDRWRHRRERTMLVS